MVKSSEKLRDLVAGQPPKSPSSAKPAAKKKAPVQAVKPRREQHKLQSLANENTIKELGLSAAERTAYHHAHSLPIMAALRQWGCECAGVSQCDSI